MNATQTVQLGTRTYSFTTEGAQDGSGIMTLGSLFNSRGQFYGYVVESCATGARTVLTMSKTRYPVAATRTALAVL